ncbi:MAG TPA: Hpt domain-containing protein [Deltaproteobacteria bacterium]|nr:Hpt domain-containing protein [Deltaproteobacteria bacterium]HOM29240.1 Hpt domain-containing protein [Deltaproteobacteria bacterium]HPP79461.1 Hpt domain-containing protein [Deltaproteobacteria bacterium]
MDDLVAKDERMVTRDTLKDEGVPGVKAVCCETPDRPFSTSADGEEGDPIDLEQALSEFDGDRDFLQGLLRAFLENVGRQIPALRRAIGTADAQEVRSLAHAIKGGAGNLGAQRLAECAWAMERMAGEGGLARAHEALERLEAQHERLKRYVSERL